MCTVGLTVNAAGCPACLIPGQRKYSSTKTQQKKKIMLFQTDRQTHVFSKFTQNMNGFSISLTICSCTCDSFTCTLIFRKGLGRSLRYAIFVSKFVVSKCAVVKAYAVIEEY